MSETRSKDPKKRKGFEKVFFILAAGFFVMHFGLSIIYTLPKEYFPPKMRELAAGYMYPSFYQGWSLFAPNVPKWHSSLSYRYFKEGKWSDWLGADSIPGYRNHPVHARVSQKFSHYLTNQVQENLYYENGQARFDRIVGQGHYRSAVYLIRAQLFRQEIRSLDSLQLQLTVNYAPPPGNRMEGEQRTVEFPILAISPSE